MWKDDMHDMPPSNSSCRHGKSYLNVFWIYSKIHVMCEH